MHCALSMPAKEHSLTEESSSASNHVMLFNSNVNVTFKFNFVDSGV